MSKNFSIGVPCYSSLVLPIYEMTLVCSDNKSKSISVEREIRYETSERIAKITGCHSANKNSNYLLHINFFADSNSMSIFDVDSRYRVINNYRGLVDLDSDNLTLIRIKLLDLKRRIEYIRNNPYTSEFYNGIKKDFDTLYEGKSRTYDLRKYLDGEYEFFNSMTNNLDRVLNIDYSDMFSTYIDTLTDEKVVLYLCYYYLDGINKAMEVNDIKKAQEYSFFISSFVERNIVSKSRVYVGDYIVDYNYVKFKFLDILKRYPQLKIVLYDRDFFLGKDLDDNKNVINSLVNMSTIRTDELFIKGGHVDRSKSDSSRVINPISEEESILVKKYLDDKLYAYLRNNPSAQIVCSNQFANYIAFLYENGMITADRFKGIYRLSETQSDAVYVFDADNFEEKILLNKQQLIGNTPRIFHNPGWEDKVRDVSLLSTSSELHDKGLELIKKRVI